MNDDDDESGYGVAPEARRILNGDNFEPRFALAALLISEKAFLNDHWLKTSWPQDARDAIAIYVPCSDVFAWGCADAEEASYGELRDLWDHHARDPVYGCEVWCMKKRRMLPQSPVYRDVQAAGIWNLDTMGLRANSYDAACAWLHALRTEPASSWENEGGACLAA